MMKTRWEWSAQRRVVAWGGVVALAAAICLSASVAGAGKPPYPKSRPSDGALSETAAPAVAEIAPPVLPTPKAAAPSLALTATSLASDDIARYRTAFATLASGNYDAAMQLAAGGHSPVAAKLVTWMWISQAGSRLGFDQVTDFIRQNPTWPAQDLMERRAEETLSDATDDLKIIAWFKPREPLTGEGKLHLAEALLRTGQAQAGTEWLRRAWIGGTFNARDESEILKRHRDLLRHEDHVARLDRLLWDDDSAAARRMLPRVPEDVRALAEARLALIGFLPGVERLVGRVPPALRNDLGLAYDRVRWRRQKGHDDQALEILLTVPANAMHADRWWFERQTQARRALAGGRISDAYKLASQHGDVDIRNFIDAEWLSGWLALRFLHEQQVALTHFARIYDTVTTPVSKARGAYWAGRSVEVLGDAAAAKHWYETAAAHATTYYGQLAALKLGRTGGLTLPPEPEPTAAEITAFQGKDLVQAASLLAGIGLDERLRPFILRLSDLSRTPADHKQVAELADRLGHVELGVVAAKRSARNGVILVDRAFPLFDLPRGGDRPEQPLVLAVSRQESEFNPLAISSAGARGLMQLMPATARSMAKVLRVAYQPELLTADPAYNAKLGSRYLSDLLDNYGGSYVLTLAAYNAGDSRVRQWIRDWGDPRRPEVDAIDWIELIPFAETRNYVERVFEGLQVYRQRLHPTSSVLSALDDDLHSRSHGQSCNC
jgi:soluble lytic murein transglycosylase